jgi:hypothetical protein
MRFHKFEATGRLFVISSLRYWRLGRLAGTIMAAPGIFLFFVLFQAFHSSGKPISFLRVGTLLRCSFFFLLQINTPYTSVVF